VIKALLLLIVGLMVLKLTAVWFIWKRMDRFEDQLDYIEEHVWTDADIVHMEKQ
jgi:hypothetical protein